jgi:hypothetical protein
MNPSMHSISLKKIHLYLQSLVEGHFCFIYFSALFHFEIYSFRIVPVLSVDPVL